VSRLSRVEAHKPCCVVVVNHFGARFFRYWLGKMSELGEQNYRINVSQWKRKDLGHVAHPGIKATRGSQPDAFQDRIDAQYLHLCKEIAKRTASVCRKEDLHTIFLVGSERLTRPIETALPKTFRPRVALIAKDLGNFSVLQLQQRLEPSIAEWTAKQVVLKPGLPSRARGEDQY